MALTPMPFSKNQVQLVFEIYEDFYKDSAFLVGVAMFDVLKPEETNIKMTVGNSKIKQYKDFDSEVHTHPACNLDLDLNITKKTNSPVNFLYNDQQNVRLTG